jgi:two-component system, NarL family, sensor histidine kinase UhpB
MNTLSDLPATNEPAPQGGTGSLHDPFEALPRGLGHAAGDAILTVDEQHRIVMLDPAAQRMFGCSANEALGSPLSRFIPAPFRDAHAEHIRHFDASGAAERRMGGPRNVTALRADGEEFHVEVTITGVDVLDERGLARRQFTAFLKDLTDEQSLRVENELLRTRMRAIFSLAPIAIWITHDETIAFANQACATLFGAPRGEALVGRPIYPLLCPESHEPVRNAVAKAQSGGSAVVLVSERIARPDGSVREVEIAVAALPDHGRTAVQMVLTDVTERSREKQELERSRRELRRLSANLVDAREEERRRIARELHDELGQRLTALKMELSALGAPGGRSARDRRVGAMLDMVDETVASVRRIATELRPLMLDDLGLNAAIEWLASGWARRMGIAVSLHLDQDFPPVVESVAIAVFRMVQEALTNVARHARATEVRVEIRHEANQLALTVEDNGRGFPERSMYREGSHGLMGIRERAYMLGGQLEIGSSSLGGGRLAVRLPLAPAADRLGAIEHLPEAPEAGP